jgi:hypothetical protein
MVQPDMKSSGQHPLEGEAHVDGFEMGTPQADEPGWMNREYLSETTKTTIQSYLHPSPKVKVYLSYNDNFHIINPPEVELSKDTIEALEYTERNEHGLITHIKKLKATTTMKGKSSTETIRYVNLKSGQHIWEKIHLPEKDRSSRRASKNTAMTNIG